MNKPRLLLHIGSQRAGCSPLQRSLRDARDALLGSGILYGSLDRGKHPFKHATLSPIALSHDLARVRSELSALQSETRASGAHTLILSDEALWNLDPTTSPFFEGLRQHFRVEVVALLRRPDIYVESVYNQALRALRNEERRTLEQFWREAPLRGRIEYHRVLQGWQRVAEQVHVFDLAKEVAQDGLLAAFFRRLGLPGPVPAEVPARASPDGRAVLTLRLLREAGVAFDPGAILAAAAAMKDQPLWAQPVRHLLGRKERSALLSACHADLSALARDHGIAFAGELPEEGDDPVHRPPDEYLLTLMGRLSAAGDSPLGKTRRARRRSQEAMKGRSRMPPEALADALADAVGPQHGNKLLRAPPGSTQARRRAGARAARRQVGKSGMSTS